MTLDYLLLLPLCLIHQRACISGMYHWNVRFHTFFVKLIIWCKKKAISFCFVTYFRQSSPEEKHLGAAGKDNSLFFSIFEIYIFIYLDKYIYIYIT
jgi:hypothetical protein